MSKLFFYTMVGVSLAQAQTSVQATPYTTNDVLASTSDAQQEFALDSISNLHQRNGELYNPQIAACIPGQEDVIFPKQQVWSRVQFSDLENRLDQAKSQHQSRQIQVGADLKRSFNPSNQSRQTAGVMLSIGQTNSTLDSNSSVLPNQNRVSPEVQAQQQAVGVYYTHYTLNGEYVNTVAQWSQSTAKTTRDISVGSQKSNTLSASVQWGKPHKIRRSNWLLEPQAQVTVAHTQYQSGAGKASSLVASDLTLLRAKIGGRATWNGDVPELSSRLTTGESDWRPTTFYLAAYIAQDIVVSQASRAQMAAQDIELKQKPWLEWVAGVQQPIREGSYLYGQVVYQKSLSGGARHGLGGNIGLRVNW